MAVFELCIYSDALEQYDQLRAGSKNNLAGRGIRINRPTVSDINEIIHDEITSTTCIDLIVLCKN